LRFGGKVEGGDIFEVDDEFVARSVASADDFFALEAGEGIAQGAEGAAVGGAELEGFGDI